MLGSGRLLDNRMTLNSDQRRAFFLRATRFGLVCFCLIFIAFFLRSQRLVLERSSDFSHLWIAGNMVWQGNSGQLYQKTAQRALLDASIPGSILELQGDAPSTQQSSRIWWWSERQDKVGSLYYPPLMAVLYAPLGALSLPQAAEVMSYLNFIFGFALAGLVWFLFGREFWFAACLLAVFSHYAFMWNFVLGQNGLVSACILVAGAVLLQSGRLSLAGICWAFLLYKPSWLAALALVLTLVGQWKALRSLFVGTSAIFLISAAITGIQVWFEYAQLLPALFSVGANTGFAFSVNDTTLFFWKTVFQLPAGLVWLPYLLIALYVYHLRGLPSSSLLPLIPGLALLLNPHVLQYDTILAIVIGLALFERWKTAETPQQRALFALVALLPWVAAMTRQEQAAALGYSLQPAVFLGTMLVLLWGRGGSLCVAKN